MNEITHIFLRHADNIDKSDDSSDLYKVDISAIYKSDVLNNIHKGLIDKVSNDKVSSSETNKVSSSETNKVSSSETNKGITFKTYINSGNDEALVFIVKYLNFYKDGEIPAPEHPLLENISLNDLFEDEECIFGDLLYLENIEKNMPLLSNLLNIAEELQINTLWDKLSAITCYYMQSLSSVVDDIKVKNA